MSTRPQYLAPYSANHERVRRVRGRAALQLCECGSRARDWALIHGKDGADPASYVAACRSCHHDYDKDTETYRAGFDARSQNPAWRASRLAIPRDDQGRWFAG